MFSRLSAALQSAVDTIAPPVPRLHDFVYHWRALMKFYDDSSEALNIPIESTRLPIHLEHMLTALQDEHEEEQRKSAGETQGRACLDYLIQHRVPDLLASLACADTPSGMRHLGLVFFSRLVPISSEQLLRHSALHEPVQRMLRLCGQVRASPTETQEVRLLCVLAAVIGQHPQLAPLFCVARKQSPPPPPMAVETLLSKPIASETPDIPPIQAQAGTSSQLVPSTSSQSMIKEDVHKDNLLAEALLRYIDSADGRLRIKACESLLVLAAQPFMGPGLAKESSLTTRLSVRLAKLHKELPIQLDPAEFDEMQVSWGMDNPFENRDKFHGCRQLAAFLSWMDFCDKIITDSDPEVSNAIVSSIRENFLCNQLQPRILAGAELAFSEEPQEQVHAEACVVVLALLARLLHQSHAKSLRDGLANWIVGIEPADGSSIVEEGEKGEVYTTLLRLLGEAHGDISLESMRLFEALVEEAYDNALHNLVFSYIEGRNSQPSTPPEMRPARVVKEGPKSTDPAETRLPTSSVLAPTNIHLVLESLLQLLPPGLRSAETEAGYESYLQDAQRQYEKMWSRCHTLGWPLEFPVDDDCASSDSRPEAERRQNGDVGPLLGALLNRLEAFPEQEYELNLQLTALLSRLALLPHAALHDTLLSHHANQSVLGASLKRLSTRLTQEAGEIDNIQTRLKATRHRLLGDPAIGTQAVHPHTSDEAILESIVVLEEFSKELAAIAFVKYHLHSVT